MKEKEGIRYLTDLKVTLSDENGEVSVVETTLDREDATGPCDVELTERDGRPALTVNGQRIRTKGRIGGTEKVESVERTEMAVISILAEGGAC